MIKILRLKSFIIFASLLFLFTGRLVLAWFEYPTNPVYDPIITAEKAYYPSVLKMGPGDYRMWYQSNSTPGNTVVAYATSVDGISWMLVTNQVSGLLPNNAGHPHVEFAGGKFRIWYWNAAVTYGNNAMHYAESVDGVTWTNDSAITGNLTNGGVADGWNKGIYGAVDVIINDHAKNTGTNPFDYAYAMYFDATSGGYEQIALGYSVDGTSWTLYGSGPVLPKGPAGSWDSGYVAIGSTVIKGAFWTMWYSGGISASNEGIGCATSINGFEWVKCPNNPAMSKNDGIPWRNNRTYTPKIIREGSTYKMWFTGRDTATGNYAIGYATSDPQPVSGNLYLKRKSSGEATLPDGAIDIVLDNESILNLASTLNSVSNGTVVIADVVNTLSSFTGGDLTGVDLSTPKNIGGRSVTIGKAIKLSSGSSSIPIKVTNSAFGSADVSIPDATTILAPSSWDGIIIPPKMALTSGDTAPAGFSVGTAVDVGSSTDVLFSTKPVQVILSGITGSVGYKPAGLTTWTRITATCDGTYDAPTLSSTAFPGECSITNGIDTKILTYHFTTFGELIPSTAIPTPASSSPNTNNTITVVKHIINDNGGTATNFPLFVNGVSVKNGESIRYAPGTYIVSETTNPNYTATFSGDCNASGQVIHGGINTQNDTCVITNDDIGAPVAVPPVPPLIDVVKVANPLALPSGPGAVTYTYALTNVGTVPIGDITLIGDTCGPITLVYGDINADSKLDMTETWIYACSTTLAETHTNTVVATGWANGLSAVDIASATVVVGLPIVPPLIHITKVPSPLTLSVKGGAVTFTERVTNPGIVALNNVRVTDNKCNPLTYVYGDTNNDSKLDPVETWIYTCRTNLAQTTVNTAIASGEANGITAKDLAIVTVVVADTDSVFSELVRTVAANLSQGSSGNNVKIIQQFLISQNKGLAAQALAKVGPTAYFGVLTKAALAEFQASVGINPAYGNFGPITRGYLNEHF